MGFKKKETGIYSYFKNSDKKQEHQFYYYDATVDGKTKKIRSYETDIKEVRKERKSHKSDKKESRTNPTLNEIAKNYVSVRTNRPMPDAEYKKYLKWAENGIGRKRVASITQNDISRFKTMLEDADVQPRARLIQLKALLRSGGSSVSIKVASANKKAKRFFTDDELAIIFDMAQRINPQLDVFIKTLLYTGQRPKNLLQLDIIDIDFDKNRIDFAEIKGQEAEYIPISNKLKPLLQEYVAGRRGRVFTYSHDYLSELSQEIFDTFNRPLYYEDGMSKEEEKESRKHIYKTKRHRWASFYSLRHTTAVLIIKNTGSVYKAQQILRHTDIKMTQVYAQLLNEDKEDAVNAI